jgi:acyl-CoA synthetase (AMP-forming)/AMP-acid ligase II
MANSACALRFSKFVMCAGRVDDVINVSGHRIGTAEVEGALSEHPLCAEAAVVPMEHPIKGQGIYAYVTLMVVSPWHHCKALHRSMHLWLSPPITMRRATASMLAISLCWQAPDPQPSCTAALRRCNVWGHFSVGTWGPRGM